MVTNFNGPYLDSIIRHFQVQASPFKIKPYGSGHINDTFLVEFQGQKKSEAIILQRINHLIFLDPPGIIDNITRVTNHIRQKLIARHLPEEEISRRVLTLIPTKDGENYIKDDNGNYWRIYKFIQGTRSDNTVQSPTHAFQVAYTFAQFLYYLRDLPGPPLNETIRDFHHGSKRFDFFQSVLAQDTLNRATSARQEIDFLLAQADIFKVIPELIQKGEIPNRVSHNDTKVNNVLLDESSGEGLCVIDLDTVMPGTSLYDFGDLARSTLSSKAEDERDLSEVHVEIPVFKALVKGFLSGSHHSLTTAEHHHLVLSTHLMSLMIGMRFLTDHLQGDTYFKIHRHNQNLDRCRRQFKLVQSIIEHQEEMMNLIEKET